MRHTTSHVQLVFSSVLFVFALFFAGQGSKGVLGNLLQGSALQ